MKRINLFRNGVRSNPVTLESVTWGKSNFDKTTSALVFAGILIVCSIGVGCSSDKPQTASSNNQSALTPPTPPVAVPPASMPVAPVTQAAAKPVHKKVVHRAPITVAYDDKTSGVSFQYPRKYSLKTVEAADKMVSSDGATGYVQPGGVAIAAVEVPESAYPKSDLGSAFFDVSMNKAMTAEQCSQFPEVKAVSAADPAGADAPAAGITPKAPKLMIGNMELQSFETRYNEGKREETSKYYHVFENGACYEFALKVATTGVETDGGKPVDRAEVFKKLEGILATVKIGPKADEATTTSSAAVTPAQ